MKSQVDGMPNEAQWLNGHQMYTTWWLADFGCDSHANQGWNRLRISWNIYGVNNRLWISAGLYLTSRGCPMRKIAWSLDYLWLWQNMDQGPVSWHYFNIQAYYFIDNWLHWCCMLRCAYISTYQSLWAVIKKRLEIFYSSQVMLGWEFSEICSVLDGILSF